VPNPSLLLADNLAKNFSRIENSRSQLEDLCTKGQLPQKITTQMYEGLFLSAHVAFESFLEELFIGLLLENQGVKSSRRDVVPRIVVKTHKVARGILFPKQRQYIDWLPYDNTLVLAEKFFREGRPFSNLTEQEKTHLLKSQSIRNVVAHNSRFSRSKFDLHVIGNTPLPPSEKTPSGYLRGLYRIAPVQTRYENLVAQLLQIARKLAT